MNASSQATVISLIDDAARALREAGVAFGHGTTNAEDEAAWLVLWQLGLPLDTELEGPVSVADDPVDAEKAAEVERMIRRRIDTRIPAAYLTREAWLQGLPFYVDQRAIVPRSLIAEVMIHPEYGGSIDPWLSAQTHAVLDLCTGNGSLAVIAALTWPDVIVDATDLSLDALEVARINVERHGLAPRIRLLQSDGMASLPGRYDLILCNPPYVNDASMASLPAEFRAEPTMALAGGADGMDFVRRLLADAPTHMTEHAVLVLEIGNERQHFEDAFATLEAVWLDTSAGSDQILLVTHEALLAWQARSSAAPAQPESA